MSTENFIKPYLLFIIPVLNIVGAFIKISSIKDKFIPLILGLLGISISITYMFLFESEASLSQKIFNGVVQGILCSGSAVYADQLIKQSSKNE